MANTVSSAEFPSSVTGRLRSLRDLPDDVLRPIFGFLHLDELENIGATSKLFHEKVGRLGWPLYLSRHPVSYISLHPYASKWAPRELISFNRHVNINIAEHRFRASLVGPAWSQTAIPAMDMTSDQLIIAVGSTLHLHDMLPPIGTKGGKRAREARVVRCRPEVIEVPDGEEAEAGRVSGEPRAKGGKGDITGVKALRDGQTLLAFADGSISRFDTKDDAVQTAAFHHPPYCIQSLAMDSRDHFVATATNGQVSVYDAHGAPRPLHSFSLPTTTGRAWSSLIATHSIPGLDPFLALGVTGLQPLQIHTIGPTGEPSETASRVLQGPTFRSSPYSLLLPPPSSRHSPSSLLSAWFDSQLRIFDLRSSSPHAVISLQDPWSDNALYSCAWLGENYVAAGASRHGLVSIYDVRFPKLGWSCFAPGSKGSPVYAMIGDGGRLWGVAEKQSWVLEFDGTRAVDPSARPLTTSVEEDAIGARGEGRWVRGVDRRGRSTPHTASLPRSWVVGYEHRDQTVQLFESAR